MKFKNIKAFEDFHSMEENEMDKMFAHEEEMYASEEENSDDYDHEREEEENEDEAVEDERAWGDEGTKLERFSTFNEKKKATKKDDEEGKKPDFKDFDKDGDKKEPMTKALKDKEKKEEKGGKKFEKPKKGEIPAALAAYQKKKK